MSVGAKAQPKLPFNLKPTSLKGVYSFVPPPKGTDLTKASRATLLKHGVLMRRPDPDREPERFALWTRFVTEFWTEDNFVQPTFGTPDTITHNLKGGLRQTEGGAYASHGWSGVVVVGKWVGAMGMWKVPRVSPPSTPVNQSTGVWQSSSWVGLDGGSGLIPGTTTTDVLQAGVSQNIVQSTGHKAYYAWYEWVVADLSVSNEFPWVYPIPITSVPVLPGHEICVVVQYVKQYGADIADPRPPAGPYHFGGVLLTNVTTGKSANLWLAPPTGASFAGESAEWIMECPDGFYDTLPKFSSVNFREAGACNVHDAPPGSYAGVELGKADTVFFQDSEGIVETNVNASTGIVNINYQG